MFSFNAPQGACPACNGIGSKMEMNPDLVVPNKDLSLNEGAIVPWAKSDNKNNYYYQMLQAVAQHFKFSMDTPFKDLTEEQQHILLYGTNEKVSFNFKRRNRSYRVNRKFEGVIARLERLFVETKSNYNRKYISKFMSDRKCPVCDGKRLKPESTDRQLFERAFEHLNLKFGINGYAKFYLKDTEYEKFLEDIREILKNKEIT